MGSRLVSASVMAELSQYISELSFEHGKVFSENVNRRKWRQICKDAGLADFRFHDLRKAFGSMLAQNEISTVVAQELLEHSSPNLTNKVYRNVDPVLRHAVDQLAVGDWL